MRGFLDFLAVNSLNKMCFSMPCSRARFLDCCYAYDVFS
jgi:hypothetical protein